MRSQINLLFNIDRSFRAPFLVTLASLLDNLEKDIQARVFVAHTAGQELEIEPLLAQSPLFTKHAGRYSIETVPVSLEHYESRLNTNRRLHSAAYLRAFAVNHLPESVDRVIYLDSDMLVRGSLAPLMDLKFSEPLAAVPDYMSRHALVRPGFGAIAKKFGYSRPPAYFNSGLMVIDRQKWIAAGISEKTAALLENYKFPLHDQDALNIVCSGNFHALDSSWNWPYHLRQDVLAWRLCNPGAWLRQDIRIIHFVESRKPWHEDYEGYFRDAYMEYLGKIPSTLLPRRITRSVILRLLKGKSFRDISLCKRYWISINRIHLRLWLWLEEESGRDHSLKGMALLILILVVRLLGGKEIPPSTSWFLERKKMVS